MELCSIITFLKILKFEFRIIKLCFELFLLKALKSFRYRFIVFSPSGRSLIKYRLMPSCANYTVIDRTVL